MSTEKEQTIMSTIHPIHPTLQFEAKHAMRFLDNLLQSSTSMELTCLLSSRKSEGSQPRTRRSMK